MNMPTCTSHAPWKAEFGLYGWAVLSTRGEEVAFIRQSIVHDGANARLISSAPDLLAALERLAHPMADDEDLANAHSVIAKALGMKVKP